MNRSVTFPFVPRSTAFLQPGFFWPVRLSDGRYSAAVALVVDADPGDTWSIRSSRSFAAGLLTWTGAEPPTARDLAGADLVDWGEMHVKAIADHGEQITGRWDGTETLTKIQKVSHRAGGVIGLFANGHVEGRATDEQARTLPLTSTWGVEYLWRVADRAHVKGRPIAR